MKTTKEVSRAELDVLAKLLEKAAQALARANRDITIVSTEVQSTRERLDAMRYGK